MKLYLFLIILGFVWFGRAQNNATNATTAAASNATAAAANNTAAAANATAAAANATVANATNATAAAANATVANATNATNATAAAANQTVANATNATAPSVTAVAGGTEVEWVEEANFIDQEALLNMLNEADLTTNPILGDSLDFGVEYLDVWGVEEGYLEEGQEYVLDSVNVIQNQQGNETLAFFDVTLKDVNASVINATNATNATGAHSFFVGVYYDSSTTNRSINQSYVIDPLFVSPDGGNFLYQNWTTSYSWSDFNGNRDNSKDIFFFGLNTVLGRAVALGILDSPHYYVEKLFAAASSTANTAAGMTSEQFFVYDAQLSTQALGNVEVIFSVKVQQNIRQLDRWNLFEV